MQALKDFVVVCMSKSVESSFGSECSFDANIRNRGVYVISSHPEDDFKVGDELLINPSFLTAANIFTFNGVKLAGLPVKQAVKAKLDSVCDMFHITNKYLFGCIGYDATTGKMSVAFQELSKVQEGELLLHKETEIKNLTDDLLREKHHPSTRVVKFSEFDFLGESTINPALLEDIGDRIKALEDAYDFLTKYNKVK